MTVDDLIDSIKSQGFYASQITEQRVIQGTEAQTAPLQTRNEVTAALRDVGIEELYQHQVDAISAVRDGTNVVVATPTASGKSLTYTVPAAERAILDGRTTLYVAPQVALLNDQAQTLNEFGDALGSGAALDAAAYHSEVGKPERKAIKSRQPDVVLTTPDMLHLSVLPYGKSSNNWRWLMETLEHVVIDEVHHYRGVFGSHVSLILRRLNRLVEQFGNSPRYICCSATIGNPVEHAAAVTGQAPDTYTLVDTDTSSTGDRHWTLWNPPVIERDSGPDAASSDATASQQGSDWSQHLQANTRPASADESASSDNQTPDDVGGERRSNHQEAIELLIELLQEGYQTLVFTGTRQGAERYAMQTDNRLRKAGHRTLADNVCAYHGRVDDTRRSDIEYALKNGSMRGVWSTNALELGIDIGTLDAVILDGYPGSIMATFQRAGRAGRGDDECAVFLVGSDNPLDQHMMQNPDALFDEDVEKAVVNTENETILPGHVVCAANEHPITPADDDHFGDILPDIVTDAAESDRLRKTMNGTIRWRCNEENPNWEMRDQIRSIDEEKIVLKDQHSGDRLTELGLNEAIRDAHPNAVYHHRKTTYQVSEVDYDVGTASLEDIGDTNRYTQPLYEKDVTVHERQASSGLSTAAAAVDTGVVTLTVSQETDGYLIYQGGPDDEPTEKTFSEEQKPPSYDITTEGLFIAIPSEARAALPRPLDSDTEYVAGLHAIEHAMISLLPSQVLCDRRDVGGLSTNYHGWTGTGTIYVHDGYAGGVGLSATAYEDLPELFEETYRLISNCQCDDGCPSCIHSPHCGNANRKLSKQHGRTILEECLLDADH